MREIPVDEGAGGGADRAATRTEPDSLSASGTAASRKVWRKHSAICLATGRLWRSSRLTERSGAPPRRGAGRPGKVAGRVTDWPSVWLSESEGGATVVSPQSSIVMTCIEFSGG